MALCASGGMARWLDGGGEYGAGGMSCQRRGLAGVVVWAPVLLWLGCVGGGCAEETLPASGDNPPDWDGSWWDSQTGSCGAAYCQHRGDCYGWDEETGEHRCRCWRGYEGPFCEIDSDECAPSLCRNRAACAESSSDPSVAPGDYRCDCRPGYSGSTCEDDVDECGSEPCANGGVCSELVDAYTCQCQHGYSGPECNIDIDECVPSPCVNGAECLESGRDTSVPVGARLCRCITGYTGVHCEIDLLDPCTSSPCTNDATCTVAAVGEGFEFGYECGCKPGFSGERCETCDDGYAGRSCEAISQSASETEPNLLLKLVTVVGAIVVVLVACFGVWHGCRRVDSDWCWLLQDYCRLYCCGCCGHTAGHTVSPDANWLRVGPDAETQTVYYYNLSTGEEATSTATSWPPASPSVLSRQLGAIAAEQQPLEPRSPVVPRQLFLEEDRGTPFRSSKFSINRQLAAQRSYTPSIATSTEMGNIMNPLSNVWSAGQPNGAQHLAVPVAGDAENAMAQSDLPLAGWVTRVYRRWLKWRPDPSGSHGNDFALDYGLRLRSKTSAVADSRLGTRGSWPVVDAALNGEVFDGEPGEDNGVRRGHVVLRIGKYDVRKYGVTGAIRQANADEAAKLLPRQPLSCQQLCPCWPPNQTHELPGAAAPDYHTIEWTFAVIDTPTIASGRGYSPPIGLRPEPEPEPDLESERDYFRRSASETLQLIPVSPVQNSDAVQNICRREDLGYPSPEKVERMLDRYRDSSNPVASATKALRAEQRTHRPSSAPKREPEPEPEPEPELHMKKTDTAKPKTKPFAQRISPSQRVDTSPARRSGSRSRSTSRSPSPRVGSRPRKADRGGGQDTTRRSRKPPSPPIPPAYHHRG